MVVLLGAIIGIIVLQKGSLFWSTIILIAHLLKKLQEHLSWRLLVGPEACILHSPTKTQTACVSPSSYFFSIKSGDNHKDHHSFCSAYYSNNVSLALIL